jgi:hypothetical protein
VQCRGVGEGSEHARARNLKEAGWLATAAARFFDHECPDSKGPNSSLRAARWRCAIRRRQSGGLLRTQNQEHAPRLRRDDCIALPWRWRGHARLRWRVWQLLWRARECLCQWVQSRQQCLRACRRYRSASWRRPSHRPRSGLENPRRVVGDVQRTGRSDRGRTRILRRQPSCAKQRTLTDSLARGDSVSREH